MRRFGSCLFIALLCFCHPPNPDFWQVGLKSRCYAQPVIDGENVYIVSGAGEVLCLRNQTGAKLWQLQFNDPIVAAPALSGDSLFVGSQSGSIIALDKRTGKQKWRRNFAAGEGFEAPLTALGEIVLAPSTAGNLYALSQANGSIQWQHQGRMKFNTAAVISGSNIYIGNWGANFYSLGLNGKENWQFKATARIVEDAAIFRNTVYFPTHDRFVYALDAPSGRLRWRFQAEYPTNLVFIQDKLMFGSQSNLYAINPETGELIKKIATGKTISRIYSSGKDCLIVGDRVYANDLIRGTLRTFLSLPNGQHPFRLTLGHDRYIISDDLFSVFGIRSKSANQNEIVR